MRSIKFGYIALMVLLLVSAFVSVRHFSITRTERDAMDINSFPMNIGDWQGSNLEISEQEYKILETRNLLLRDYTNPKTGKNINLFIVYSETNRSVFHPPEVCLMGSGIEMSDKKATDIEAGEQQFMVNELSLQKGDSRMTGLYFYTAGDFYTDNFYLQQAVFAFNQIFNRKKGGATIRVMALVDGNEESAVAGLQDFMKQVVLIFQSM